eukprot:2523935-Amphidinium_carterae.1
MKGKGFLLKIAREVVLLVAWSELDIIAEHVPAEKNELADALSRLQAVPCKPFHLELEGIPKVEPPLASLFQACVRGAQDGIRRDKVTEKGCNSSLVVWASPWGGSLTRPWALETEGECSASSKSGIGAEGTHAVGSRDGAEEVVPPRSDGPKRKEYKRGKTSNLQFSTSASQRVGALEELQLD